MILDVIIYTMTVFGGVILGFCIKKEPSVISLADSDLLVELLENYRKTCKQLDKGHRRKNRLIKRLRCELNKKRCITYLPGHMAKKNDQVYSSKFGFGKVIDVNEMDSTINFFKKGLSIALDHEDFEKVIEKQQVSFPKVDSEADEEIEEFVSNCFNKPKGQKINRKS